jgi:hypothetical protein
MAGISEVNRPDASAVSEFHTFADTDSGREAIHHTLGPGANQAASGAHTHNGNDSPMLIPGTIISGTKASVAWASSINAILVSLGAVDNST